MTSVVNFFLKDNNILNKRVKKFLYQYYFIIFLVKNMTKVYIIKRACFEIPNSVNVIAVDADNDSPADTLVHFYPPVLLGEGKTLFHIIPKLEDDNIVINNIFAIGGAIIEEPQESVVYGHFKIRKDGRAYGFLSLEKIKNDIWMVSDREPEAYLYRLYLCCYGLSLKDCKSPDKLIIETNNVLKYLVIYKEDREERVEAEPYLLLPTDKVAEFTVKTENGKTWRYKITWNNGNPEEVY